MHYLCWNIPLFKREAKWYWVPIYKLKVECRNFNMEISQSQIYLPPIMSLLLLSSCCVEALKSLPLHQYSVVIFKLSDSLVLWGCLSGGRVKLNSIPFMAWRLSYHSVSVNLVLMFYILICCISKASLFNLIRYQMRKTTSDIQKLPPIICLILDMQYFKSISCHLSWHFWKTDTGGRFCAIFSKRKQL